MIKVSAAFLVAQKLKLFCFNFHHSLCSLLLESVYIKGTHIPMFIIF